MANKYVAKNQKEPKKRWRERWKAKSDFEGGQIGPSKPSQFSINFSVPVQGEKRYLSRRLTRQTPQRSCDKCPQNIPFLQHPSPSLAFAIISKTTNHPSPALCWETHPLAQEPDRYIIRFTVGWLVYHLAVGNNRHLDAHKLPYPSCENI